MPDQNRAYLSWLPLERGAIDEVVDRISAAALGESPPVRVATANVDFLALGRRDPAFRSLLKSFELVVADGVPLVWLATLSGQPVKGRVNGTDLVEACALAAVQHGFRIALVGGMPGSAEATVDLLTTRHPGLDICAVETPMLTDHAAAAAVAEQVRRAGAQVVLVGLGAPRQEWWIKHHLEACGARAAIGVGGSFDILAGTFPRAPAWMRRGGLEWFWRLLQDPGRLAHRYIVVDLPTLASIATWALRRRFGGRPDASLGVTPSR